MISAEKQLWAEADANLKRYSYNLSDLCNDDSWFPTNSMIKVNPDVNNRESVVFLGHATRMWQIDS